MFDDPAHLGGKHKTVSRNRAQKLAEEPLCLTESVEGRHVKVANPAPIRMFNRGERRSFIDGPVHPAV